MVEVNKQGRKVYWLRGVAFLYAFCAGTLLQAQVHLFPLRQSASKLRSGAVLRPFQVLDLNCPGPARAIVGNAEPLLFSQQGGILEVPVDTGYLVFPGGTERSPARRLWIMEEVRDPGFGARWVRASRVPLSSSLWGVEAATLVLESPLSGRFGVLLLAAHNPPRLLFVPRNTITGHFLLQEAMQLSVVLKPARVLSLSNDPASGEILIAYRGDPQGAPRSPRFIVAMLGEGGIGGAERLVVACSFPPPVPVAEVFFGVWYVRDGLRGILFPWGETSHQGLLWVPMPDPAGRSTRPLSAPWFSARLVGVKDRFLRTGFIKGDTLYAVGAETGRVYCFDLNALGPSLPPVPGVSTTPEWGRPETYFLSWSDRELSPDRQVRYEVQVLEQGEPLLAQAVELQRGGTSLAGVLPGTAVEVVLSKVETATGRELARSPALRYRLPGGHSWTTVRFALPGPETLAGVCFDRVHDLLLCAATSGSVVAFRWESLAEALNESQWDESAVVDLTAEASYYFGGDAVPLGFVTAFCLRPQGGLWFFNGFEGRGAYSPGGEGLISSGLVETQDFQGIFACDAAFESSGRVLFLADPAAGRLYTVDTESGRTTVGPNCLPLSYGSATLPGAGPWGVSTDGDILYFLWKRPGGEEYILWSSSTQISEAAPVPWEVIPLQPGTEVAGLEVVQEEQQRYAFIAAHDAEGPFVLAKPLEAQTAKSFSYEVVSLAPGEEYRIGPVACPNLWNKSYRVLVSRLESDFSAPPCTLHLFVLNNGGEAAACPPFELASGELVLRTFPTAGHTQVVLISDAQNPASCRIGLGLSVTGEGTACLYGDMPFIRGDLNGSGRVDLADAIQLLGYLFGGRTQSFCADSADINDNGKHTIADPVALLTYLFAGQDTVAAPFPGCGQDPTPDSLPPCSYQTACVEPSSR